MKLLYLYIEDYNCIKNQEFNFDSKYRFQLKRGKNNDLILEKVTTENPLPDEFWTMSKERKGVVESVSAIVGNNGSGKTSLANFLGDYIGYRDIDNLEKEKKYLVIFKRTTDSLPQYWTNLDPLKLKINCNISIVDESKNPSEKYLPIIYFSPFFTTEHIIKPYRCIDISTSGLLNNLQMGRYKAKEYINALIFLSEYYTKIKNQEISKNNTQNKNHEIPNDNTPKKNHEIPIELPEPKGIQISIDLGYAEDILYQIIGQIKLQKIIFHIRSYKTSIDRLGENKDIVKYTQILTEEEIKLIDLFTTIEKNYTKKEIRKKVNSEKFKQINQDLLKIINEIQIQGEKYKNKKIEKDQYFGQSIDKYKKIISDQIYERFNDDLIDQVKRIIEDIIVHITKIIQEQLAEIILCLFIVAQDDIFLLIFLSYIIYFWDPYKDTEKSWKHYHILKPYIRNLKIVEKNITGVVEFICDNSQKKNYTKVIKSIKNHKNVFKFFKLLNKILSYKKIKIKNNNEKKSKIIECSFSDLKEIKNELIDLAYIYNNINLKYDIVEFDFSPKMSSGEMSFLTIYSRIYDCIKNHQKIKDKEDIILFMDEAETTLHPDWQRKLVSQIITFLEEFAENKKVHVIFASHSPILLSDIPDSNVIFLKKNKETGYTEEVDHQETGKTFAANIHTLLAKSFFLNKTIGEFASQYIEKTCDMIEEIQDISMLNQMLPNINQRINNVAEEFIRIGLQRNLYHKIESFKTSNNNAELKNALQNFIKDLEK